MSAPIRPPRTGPFTMQLRSPIGDWVAACVLCGGRMAVTKFDSRAAVARNAS